MKEPGEQHPAANTHLRRSARLRDQSSRPRRILRTRTMNVSRGAIGQHFEVRHVRSPQTFTPSQAIAPKDVRGGRGVGAAVTTRRRFQRAAWLERKELKGPELDIHIGQTRPATTRGELLGRVIWSHTTTGRCRTRGETYRAADVALEDAVARLGCSTAAAVKSMAQQSEEHGATTISAACKCLHRRSLSILLQSRLIRTVWSKRIIRG